MKKLLTEWRKHLDEEIYGNRAVVYHGTDSLKDIETILTQGYSLEKNTAAMYGKGIYTVYELEGTNTGSGYYGPMVIKFAVDMSGKHLILDYEQAKKVHGEDYKLMDQLKTLGINTKIKVAAPEIGGIWANGSAEDLRNINKENLSAIAYEIKDIYMNDNNDVMVLYDEVALRKHTNYRVPGGVEWQPGDYIDRKRLRLETFKELTSSNWAPITKKGVKVQHLDVSNKWEKLSEILEKRQGGRTSVVAQKIHKLLSKRNRMDHHLDSITFTGANDGPVMVIYNPKKSKMLSWKKIENKDDLSVGDRVKFKDFAASYQADKMIKQLNNSVEKFYKILDAVGIKRDSKEILKYMDNPEEDLHKVFTKYLKSLRGEVIKSKPQWKSNHVKWDDEGTGHFFKKDVVVVSSKYGSEWIKDVNGKKILDYIQNLKKQKKPNLPQ